MSKTGEYPKKKKKMLWLIEQREMGWHWGVGTRERR